MEFEPTPIAGAFLLRPKVFADERGTFVKVFHQPTFAKRQLEFQTAESFYSTSCRGVIRGMHFQVPPAAHHKLVYCSAGRVLDVILDLRRGSPSEGAWFRTELSQENAHQLFIPAGVAHGFQSLEDGSTIIYSVTTAYQPDADTGVRWDSFGLDWPIADPLLSTRDREFPSVAEFDSPFIFAP